MAMSPDDMVPSGPESAGLAAIRKYLTDVAHVPVNAGNIRRALEQNARDPGSMEANGPNLGPVVLNLRNAGIEDASPMPARGGGGGGGGGGNTSAPPTRTAEDPPLIPTSTGAQPSAGASIPPPFVGFNPNAPGQVLSPAQQQLRLGGPSPTPALMGPDGVPLLGGPNNNPALSGPDALPALGAGVAAGIPLIEMLRRSLLGGPATPPLLNSPTAAPAVSGPPQVPQIAAPGEAPPIALGNQSTGRPPIPLQDANMPRPALETAGVQLSPALQPPPANPAIAPLPQTPAGDAVTKAVGSDKPTVRARTPRVKAPRMPIPMVR